MSLESLEDMANGSIWDEFFDLFATLVYTNIGQFNDRLVNHKITLCYNILQKSFHTISYNYSCHSAMLNDPTISIGRKLSLHSPLL